MMKREVLTSGKASFKIEVPYKLIETGEKKEKPLIVYLHGFRQHINRFQDLVSDLLQIEAYHLFIQGPYPIYEQSDKRKVEDWGRAWYLYDGDQGQFAKSLELTAEFIQDLIDNMLNHISASRLCLFGYSMGAYQAGYFALSRWKHVNELVMVGGRLKTELFENGEHNYGHLNILALHGKNDETVKAIPQKSSIKKVEEWGANVLFKELNEGHKLVRSYTTTTSKWLVPLGYKSL
ncbi:hypothetical protein NC796_11700 [Aliifodinibius sp. S!AR15-10]|uniref:alpha/beta hydrolase n=1 Tax=Aliifodinibius sp. S!AR15-10 TaxID=2950437 RepID=UPI0028656C82|nr:hypothetical protein [Aliifodinibius sp. S!AR15-10]MDR8391812.1 hypothetical protein [Aliifodinibius sp. S!AR15-10]